MLNKTENNHALMLLATCLTLAYVLPFHQVPFPAFYNDWLVVLGIVVVTAYYADDKFPQIQIPWIILIPVALACIVAIQTAVGMLSENWDAFLPIAYFGLVAIAIILGASLTSRPRGALRLCMTLTVAHLVAGLVSVLIASLQLAGAEIPFVPLMMLMEHKAGITIRPHANLGQANQLALLFCISIASTWWLYQIGRLNAFAATVAMTLLLWGLTVTQSRIGWIIIPVFAIIIWAWRGKIGAKPISNTLIIALLAIFAIFVIALPGIASAIGSSTSFASDRIADALASGSGRKALFEQAWQISLAHPWFGAGWFQFGPQQVMGSNFPPSIYSRHAHNIVLNFAAELGWPATIVICGVLVIWFFRSCLFRSITTEVAFAVLFFIAVLVHSMVEYPLWYAIVLMPCALLFGMVHQEQFGARKVELPHYYLLPLVFLMAFGLLGIGLDYRRVVAGFNEVEFEAMGVKWDNEATHKPDFTVFPYVYDYFRFLDMTVHTHMATQDIAFMERVAKRFGGVLTLTRMSQVYAMNGREDDAIKSALAVRRLYGIRYNQIYEDWRRAPAQYQNIFKRLPAPDRVLNINVPQKKEG